jgi:hypothetical protein
MTSVKALKTLVGIAVILTAWAVGHVQGQGQPPEDLFLIRIDAPGGETRITCEKGCAEKTQEFKCGAPRCGYTFNQNGFVRR